MARCDYPSAAQSCLYQGGERIIGRGRQEKAREGKRRQEKTREDKIAKLMKKQGKQRNGKEREKGEQ